MIAQWRQTLGTQGDLILVFSVLGILLILFTPIPPQLLDLLLILNFGFALLILLLTFYVDKPLRFSTFPSLLLIATLFRLALNIASTRLILNDADAGQVIDAVGEHVVSGNYVIGLIVFLVLVIVQYVVVTSGAQRVAEVAARFTLDSMPGKQMAIDSDINIGLITDAEAKARRKEIEREGSFYGAMDGASKFVKGDAIAGIIIIIINIVGGLAVGVAQMGMSWGEAAHTFTLLTVGDGIVTQIPALIIATGTGLIVTRAASDEHLSKEVTRQVTAHPKTLLLVGLAFLVMLMMPGIPAWPILLLLVGIGALYLYSLKHHRDAGGADEQGEATPSATPEDELYDLLTVDPIEIRIGASLIPLVGGDDSPFLDRVVGLRKQFALESGLVMPKVKVRDARKQPVNSYEVWMHGAKVGEGEVRPGHVLAVNVQDTGALEGFPTRDPSYGLPAVWVDESQRAAIRSLGHTVAEPLTVLVTHVGELVRRNAAVLLTRGETDRLIGRLREKGLGLVDELIPSVLSVGEVQRVLQSLLREKVSIRHIEQILEVLVDLGRSTKDVEQLTEAVRQRLGPFICQSLVGNESDLHVLVLDPALEQSLARTPAGTAYEPRVMEQLLTRLAAQVEKMMNSNRMPVLLCAPEMRRRLRGFTERMLPHLAVVSMAEVPPNINVRAFGTVGM